MDELVRYMAANLVSKPEEVRVNVIDGEKQVIIELSVAPEDMGKVIGKRGRIAKAIRSVVKAASLKENKRYMLDIV